PLALVLLLVGGALELAAEPKGVVGALGSTLVLLSSVVFLLELVRQAARREGLGGAHFQWADVTCKSLGQLVRRFAPLYVVSLCVALVMQPPAVTDRENDSLGRVAFAVAMIALFLFLKRLLDPAGPVVSTLTSRSPSSIIVRFRHAWYALAVTVPSSLLLLTVVGYDFTATEIHSRVRISLQFLVILAFAYALAMRWLDVARRRLAIEHARLRREAARATAKTADEPKDSMPAVEEVNLPAMSAQTTQLLRSGVLMVVAVGLWWTWAELVPALRVFDRVQIWPTLQVVEDRGEEGRYPVLDGLVATAQSAAPAASAPRAEAKPPPEPAASGAVPSNGLRPPLPTGGGEGTGDAAAAGALPSVLTLADLGLSILFLLLTTIAAKNIPGLVEIVLLRRLSIDPGARYAVSTIARYAIVILGVTLAFGALSIGWKNIQWLAAALTFGLAFGLQEIFANFVSGLIMLFERPVRIGDTISVGGVTGTVSRIRMRATTITDYENRELIVPNREFITSQLVNWTLTDSVTREVIKIGVAYGTDSERARDVLLAACRACPVVLDQPAPSVIFRTFGDSSLVFDIRVYMATRDHWARLMDDLMNRLYRACNEAGITIAFPQLDLHLKSGFPPVREEEEEAEEEEDGEGKVPGR
ncbi:MAG: mechanosensitive ion channel domain-containing protein, partial [Planctomycetota bacterium JB042]